ncbi:MarR family transcriptional regulator [Stenotrophomonas sp. YIM B06876]|uniref:MarR family winged helix-turn-helix transcriptional regulator n=1 Tax=Stenotrophomonas sp. YIM B06876 TaxID=3060211 RepID=UPI002739F9EA|nr:MarR family transcriptional regulator [Stenotrophomonas sp. YIM B06876]
MQSNDTTPGLGYLIADLSRLYGRIFDRRAAPLGLTRAQWRALKRIHMAPGLTQAALADVMDMEPIAVGRVLDRLQKAGFIERRADPHDRRCWRLFLTAHSDAAISAIEVVASSMRHDSLKDVDPGELAVTLKVLGQIRETLSQLDRIARG